MIQRLFFCISTHFFFYNNTLSISQPTLKINKLLVINIIIKNNDKITFNLINYN